MPVVRRGRYVIRYSGRLDCCPSRYAGVRDRVRSVVNGVEFVTFKSGHSAGLVALEVCTMPVVRARSPQSSVPSGEYAAYDEDFRSRFESVHDWMTCLVDADRVKRQTSSVSLFVDDGKWKGVINDKDAGRSLFVSADTLEGVWEALEAHLATGGGDWRRSYGSKGKR